MQVNLQHTQVPYTPSQFVQLVHRRVKKELRESKFNAKKIFIYDDGSKEFIVLREIMKELFSHLPIQSKKSKRPGMLLPTNLEREINSKFEQFLTGKKVNKDLKIKPLKNVLEEEIILYAKLKHLRVPKSAEPISPLITTMQAKYPETKFSLAKSLEVL